MSDLLPCPFCGGAAKVTKRDVEPQGDPWFSGKTELFVLCDCGACLFDEVFHEGFSEYGKDASGEYVRNITPEQTAITAWNRRADESATLRADLTAANHALATLRARLSTVEADLARVSEERDELLRDVRWILRMCGEDFDHQPPHVIHHRVKVDILDVCERAIDRSEAIARARQAPPSTVGQPGDGAAGGEG